MKKTSILTSAVLAAVLTAGSQAYATTTTWTDPSVNLETHSLPDGPDIEGSPYKGTISFSSLVTGGNTPYAGQTLSSGTLYVTIQNDPSKANGGFPVYAWVGPYSLTYTQTQINSMGTYTTGTASDLLAFTLTGAELAYIETAPLQTIDFQVEADCDLNNYYLSVTGTSSSVPDGGSTMVLLGGVLTTLGLIKRKMA